MNKYSIFLIALSLLFSCSNSLVDDNKTGQGNNEIQGSNTPPQENKTPQTGALIADGKDYATYELILACGYNYETPDQSGEHASKPYRHITQSYDSQLEKYVFNFILHIENDDDRSIATIKDRQRNEIKTDGKSPEELVAQYGEKMKYKWKFKLPAGMKTTNKFSHIHQLKGIDNKTNTADVGNPLITFTVRSTSSGKQEFQIIHIGQTTPETSNVYILKTNLDQFLGNWVEVEETVVFSHKGKYSVVIKDYASGKVIAEVKDYECDLWRLETTGLRPKWGLYRSFGENGSMKDQLRDECLKFADFIIEKL